MRALLFAVVLTAILGGCATDPNTKHFYLGSDVTVDGVQVDPVERTIKNDIKNEAKTSWIGISRTPLIGIDYLGLKWSPWFGCRLGYILDLGADIGLAMNTSDLGEARTDATFGLDYNVFWNLLLTAHFEQDINGDPLKIGYGACMVW